GTVYCATVPNHTLFVRRGGKGVWSGNSWEMVSDALGAIGRPRDAADVVLGIVGEAAAIEFLGYCEQAISEEAIRAILDDPDGAALPMKLGDQYALLAYIASNTRDRATVEAAAKLLRRLSTELAVLLIRDLLRADPMFSRHPAYRDFVGKHA